MSDTPPALRITLLTSPGPSLDAALEEAVHSIVAELTTSPGATFLIENFPSKDVSADLLREWLGHYLHPQRPLTVQRQTNTLNQVVFIVGTGFLL